LGLVGATPNTLAHLVPTLAQEALEDSGLNPSTPNGAVVVGSSRGAQGQWEQFLTPPYPVPHNWLDTLPHQAAVLAGKIITQPALILAPMAACASGLQALMQAYELIRRNEVGWALAGAVEVPITPLTLAGFKKMGALASQGCYPFDRRRQGLALGEGGALLVLESEEAARQRGAKIYGRILGWGLTCDALHVSSPAMDNSSAQRAIQQALARSGLEAEQIQMIHAHGTGTHLNDEREAQLIKSLFPPTVGVCSTKGATGHTLGASGALGAALTCLALQAQTLPPTVGLQEPQFDLNFGSGAAILDQALCFSFGFGGQNGVLVLQHPQA
jgi:3-oxoacyl-[acyl-carrier-protein] synthase II